jgi:hypothetical protein
MWKRVLIATATALVFFGSKINFNIGDSNSESNSKYQEKTMSLLVLDRIQKKNLNNKILNKERQYAIHQLDSKTISGIKLTEKTFSEYENFYYKNQYEKKKSKLKEVFAQFVQCYSKGSKDNQIVANRLQQMQKLECDFENFITLYAKQNADLYLRSYSYHYYGALIDMITARIKHLKIHIEEFN